MATPSALLIGEITHVKNEWESLAPAIDLKVCRLGIPVLSSIFVIDTSFVGVPRGQPKRIP